MPGGRPPKGPELVEGLEGSPDAKARLRVALETIAGEKTLSEACEALGVKEAMLHVLRTRALQAALESLEPRPMGRPRKEESVDADQIENLKKDNEQLRRALEASRAQERLRAAGLFREGEPREKKTRG